MTLNLGQSYDGLRIDAEIGRGGMGIVYRAHDPALDRDVAVKLIRAELSGDVLFRMRFDRERKAHASLEHRNIVNIYRAGEIEGNLYVAMRLIDGPSLADLLAQGRLSPERALRILAPIGDALDYAHGEGPIHRDVKPQNILLDSEERPFLTDFGLAWIPGHSRMTTTGAFVGTTAYASPEQLRGQYVDAGSDVYSLACVFYECLCGAVPFPRDPDRTAARVAASGDPASASSINPELPSALDEALRKGMATSPSDRPPSAGALVSSIAAALAPQQHRASARIAKAGTVGSARASGALRRLLPAALLASLALGLFAGYRSGDDGTATSLARSAQSDAVSLKFPAEWRRSRGVERIDGLRFEQPLGLRSGDGATAVTGGLVDATGKLLLPRSFLERLPAPPAQRQVVKLAAGSAYRYPRLLPAGAAAPLDLYVLPTTAGVATVACSSAAEDGLDPCGKVAATLELRRGRAYPLGPSTAYGRLLDRTLGALERQRARAYRELQAAGAPAAQAAAAADLRSAFESAQARLAGAKITPQSADGNEGIVSALAAAAAAYADLSAAARADDAAGYDDARSAVPGRERNVRRALRRLRKLGYEVG